MTVAGRIRYAEEKMKTKKVAKKPEARKTHFTKQMLLLSGVAVASMLLIAQIAFDVVTYNRALTNTDQTVITNLIISAVGGLSKPLPVDAATGKAYAHGADLVWPASTDPFMQILYSNEGNVGATSELQFTTKNLMTQAESKLWAVQARPSTWHSNNQTALFDQVPNLQACSRGVQVFFAPSPQASSQFQLKATKQLQNGKTLYFYTEPICHEDMSQLLAYLQQAESY